MAEVWSGVVQLPTQKYFWRARLVAKGPYVGCVTWRGAPIVDGEELDRSHRWQCLVRAEATSRAVLMGDSVPIEVDGVFLRNVEKIGEADYLQLVQHGSWAAAYAPHLPDAAPTEKIDVRGRSIF